MDSYEFVSVWHIPAPMPAVWDAIRQNGDWKVFTTKRSMNLLAPAAGPLFRLNHDVIMRWGEEGLRRRVAG